MPPICSHCFCQCSCGGWTKSFNTYTPSPGMADTFQSSHCPSCVTQKPNQVWAGSKDSSHLKPPLHLDLENSGPHEEVLVGLFSGYEPRRLLGLSLYFVAAGCGSLGNLLFLSFSFLVCSIGLHN